MVNDVKHQTKSETRKLERFEQMQLEYFSTRDADVEQTPTPEMHYTVYRNDGGAGDDDDDEKQRGLDEPPLEDR